MSVAGGRLQHVETVEDSSDDSSDDSAPPPLEDCDVPAGNASNDNSGSDSDEGPPGLVHFDDPEFESSAEEEDDGSSMPSLTDSERSVDEDSGPPSASGDEDDIPDLTGDSEEEEKSATSDDMPPDLDDPDVTDDTDTGADEMPELEQGTEDAEDSEELDSDDDQPLGQKKNPELQRGFFDAKGKKQQGSKSSYSNVNVGQKEEGAAAAAARARAQQQQQQHPYGRSKGGAAGAGMTPDQSAAFMHSGGTAGASSSAAAAAGQPARKASSWQTNEKPKKKKAEPAPPAAPAAPAEVVVANEALLAMEKEREEARRRANMAREAEASAPQPIGRCCLNRGLGDAVMRCQKDPSTAKVWPSERRVQMRCSAGCGMLWHQECWRRFQDGYEQESRSSDAPHGINITQALKVRDKARPPTVRCVTPGCPGYITFVGSFDGPVGHETFKSMQYQPTQDNLAAIKQAEEADRAAAKAAAADARAAAKAEQHAANLAAWRQRHGWKPKEPKKPRAKALQAEQQRHTAAANGNSSSIDPELLSILGGPSAANRATAAAAAEAAEAAAAAAAPKPSGITIRNRAINVMRVGVKQPTQQQQQQGEEPGSPSAASVEGSTTASQSASQGHASSRQEPDPLATLSSARASDHIDTTYHSNLDDVLAQNAAEAAAGGRRGKKKKGVKLDLASLQEIGSSNEQQQYVRPRQQQQQHQQAQPSPASQRQQQRQQQQQQQPVSMADFPSLDEAASAQAAGDDTQLEKDYLAEALNKLKLGISEAQTSQHLLLEGLSFHEIARDGKDPKAVVTQLVLDRCDKEPVAVILFERQNAAAVVMPDKETATTVNIAMFRVHMYRKQLLCSYLRDAPYDDVLHEACPDYEPESIRQKREHEEAMRELSAASAAAGGSAGPSEDRVQQLAELVKQGKLSPEALMDMLNQENGQQQQQQQQNGASSPATAAAGRKAQPSEPRQKAEKKQPQTWQQQRQFGYQQQYAEQAGTADVAATAAAAADGDWAGDGEMYAGDEYDEGYGGGEQADDGWGQIDFSYDDGSQAHDEGSSQQQQQQQQQRKQDALEAALAARGRDAAGGSSSQRSTSGSPSMKLNPMAKEFSLPGMAAAAAKAAPSRLQSASSSNGGTDNSSSATSPLAARSLNHIVDVVQITGCNNALLAAHYRNPLTPHFTLTHSQLQEPRKIAVSESVGLVQYNNDTATVEGLWVAVSNTTEGVTWKEVAEYKHVPAEVYSRVLQLQPFKARYVGEEALRITRALWEWANPAAAAAAAVQPPVAPPAATAAALSARSSSGGGLAQQAAALALVQYHLLRRHLQQQPRCRRHQQQQRRRPGHV
ncbi:hypothetical protein OEZ85_006462 [Tetradesmus obliquus]|uniref:RING-type E3 ubiquitin transferase n=1 Tax=Tetradesmus obliquus TaxID=3088 RepID=A0ABY8TUM1_TETOB|nr:hypothetical protein OEZ85_006462 [Tetradesmus obliquus]